MIFHGLRNIVLLISILLRKYFLECFRPTLISFILYCSLSRDPPPPTPPPPPNYLPQALNGYSWRFQETITSTSYPERMY